MCVIDVDRTNLFNYKSNTILVYFISKEQFNFSEKNEQRVQIETISKNRGRIDDNRRKIINVHNNRISFESRPNLWFLRAWFEAFSRESAWFTQIGMRSDNSNRLIVTHGSKLADAKIISVSWRARWGRLRLLGGLIYTFVVSRHLLAPTSVYGDTMLAKTRWYTSRNVSQEENTRDLVCRMIKRDATRDAQRIRPSFLLSFAMLPSSLA